MAVRPQYTIVEEGLHVITHLVGLAGAIYFGHNLWVSANPTYNLILAAYLFPLGMVFLASSLYHATGQPKLKSIFRKLDHISIFLLIAGTNGPLFYAYLPQDHVGILFGWDMVQNDKIIRP